jgi:membrane protein YdbS with pleckstrin-like domain
MKGKDTDTTYDEASRSSRSVNSENGERAAVPLLKDDPIISDLNLWIPSAHDLPELNWKKPINLREYVHISHIFVIQKILPWIIATAVLWVAVYAELVSIYAAELQNYLPYLAFGATASCVGLYFYWNLYRSLIEYRIERFRLFVGRGVLFRTIATAPVSPFWDFCFYQTGMDWLFGVYRVQLWGDFIVDQSILELPALSREDAYRLIRWFSYQTDRQFSLVEAVLKMEQELGEDSHPESDES